MLIKTKFNNFLVDLAFTETERHKGLMYRENLKDINGLLMIFPFEKNIKIWMKNTYFDLDVIFIDKHKKVIDIKTGKKETENIISVNAKSIAVLELPLNCAKKIHLKKGSLIEWERNNLNKLKTKNFFFPCN